MFKLFENLICLIKKRQILCFVMLVLFIVGFVLGAITLFLTSYNGVFEGFDYVYVKAVLSPEKAIFGFLLKRILQAVGLFLVVFALSINKISYYLIFLLILLRAYFLGLAFSVIVSALGVFGVMLFVFAVLLQAVISCFAIMYFVLTTYNCKVQNSVEFKFKVAIKSLIIATIGAIIEFLVLALIFRPFSFYF